MKNVMTKLLLGSTVLLVAPNAMAWKFNKATIAKTVLSGAASAGSIYGGLKMRNAFKPWLKCGLEFMNEGGKHFNMYAKSGDGVAQLPAGIFGLAVGYIGVLQSSIGVGGMAVGTALVAAGALGGIYTVYRMATKEHIHKES